MKIFVAYLISKAIGFSRYVASFGAYIISQATGRCRARTVNEIVRGSALIELGHPHQVLDLAAPGTRLPRSYGRGGVLSRVQKMSVADESAVAVNSLPEVLGTADPVLPPDRRPVRSPRCGKER